MPNVVPVTRPKNTRSVPKSIELIPAIPGTVAPSERIILGAIGIGGRGAYDLAVFLRERDVQMVAVCDVQSSRRQAGQAGAARYNCGIARGDCDELLQVSCVLLLQPAVELRWGRQQRHLQLVKHYEPLG